MHVKSLSIHSLLPPEVAMTHVIMKKGNSPAGQWWVLLVSQAAHASICQGDRR